MGLLAALVALLCVCAPPPASGAEGCSSFRHLDNGQTFFRYGGLLVIFRCRRGYKLHGYETNSCVSGHWSRETPVCVGSGCSDPGPLSHGTSSMNEDGSWAVFSCNRGFQLHGPSLLFCKGPTWNSTKPICKEADMMSSVSGVNVLTANERQNLQAAVVLKTQQQSHYDALADTASKGANLKLVLLSHTPSPNMERIKAANLKVHLQSPNFKVNGGVQTTHREAQYGQETGSGRHGSQAEASQEEAEKVDGVGFKSHLSATVSSTLSLLSGAEQSTSSPPSFSTTQTPAFTAVTDTGAFAPTSPLHLTRSALPVPRSGVLQFGGPVTSQADVTPSEGSSRTAVEDHRAETGSQYPPRPASVENANTLSTSVYSSSTSSPAFSSSSPIPSLLASTSLSPSFTLANGKTHPSNTSTTTEPRSHQTKYHGATSPEAPRLSRRPVCTYPPVPAHGTFYFRNVENPGPGQYRDYIQYACYPGYRLAHGDTHSYCQQGDTWSGITPVCLELTPCSVKAGGCSQLCSHPEHDHRSTNQTQNTTRCHCRTGFTLLDDGPTCRDVDECLLPVAVTGCVFGCVNTPGSFRCQCPAGYSLQTADSHCQDIDECAANQGLGACAEQCHNTPGSYRCSCSYGYTLAGNGHSCIAECQPGYRKQHTATAPENSMAQALMEECVDINECQEEACEWQCANLPGSHRCICPRGYALHRDGRRCKDINECSRRNGGCSHLCVNQRGGYKCACPPSHRLSSYSWKKCLPRTTAGSAGRGV